MQSALCIKKKNKPAGVDAFTRVTLYYVLSAFLHHLGNTGHCMVSFRTRSQDMPTQPHYKLDVLIVVPRGKFSVMTERGREGQKHVEK